MTVTIGAVLGTGVVLGRFEVAGLGLGAGEGVGSELSKALNPS